MQDLSKNELMIMKCVWSEQTDISQIEIYNKLKETFDWKSDRRMLNTLIFRLIGKGYLKVSREIGHMNMYVPAVPEEVVRRRKTAALLKWWYNGSIPALQSALDEGNILDEEE